jgi:hypothetical protein
MLLNTEVSKDKLAMKTRGISDLANISKNNVGND